MLRAVLADRSPPGIVLVNPDAVALGQRLEDRFARPKVVRYFDMQQFVETNRRSVQLQFE